MVDAGPPAAADRALLALLGRLDALGYDFATPTPATHARVVGRAGKARAESLRDVFGWNLPFSRELIPPDLLALLERGGALAAEGALCRSRLRASRIAGLLFLHGAYPTDRPDSVFLGPDTHRFVRFIGAELARVGAPRRIVDLGAGAGAGGILLARARPDASVILVDCNPAALRLARINAEAAGVAVETVEAASLDAVSGEIDLIVANPPFIIDPGGPSYRDGGSMNGARLSFEWALAGAKRLSPGGRMLLYTGSAILAGRDALREALERDLPALGCAMDYAEIDPDIFGEELDRPAYGSVERIAAVGAAISRRGG